MVILKMGKQMVKPFRNKKDSLKFAKSIEKKGYKPTIYKANKVYLVASKWRKSR